ncbi:MAG TPA: hypothetical protein V6C89_08995 [Drouetiella sp.]
MLQLIHPGQATENPMQSLLARGTAGETISLKFELQSDVRIDELCMSVEPSHAYQGVQSSRANPGIELFVVKKWQAAGVGVYQAAPMEVEELLLKDDRINLTDSYRKEIRSWKEILNPRYFYQAPEIPTHENVRTTLEPNRSKSFFARVKIPQKMVPGQDTFQIICQSNSEIQLTIPVRIEIGAFKLLQPPQNFFIWFKGRLDPQYPQHLLNESDFRLQLQDIYDHGFNCVSLTETDTKFAQTAIEIAEEIGFARIVLTPPFPELSKLRFQKAQPIIYLSDELDMHLEFPGNENPQQLIQYHQINYTRAEAVPNALTLVSLLNHTFIKRFQDDKDIAHGPDIYALYLNRNREFFQFTDQVSNSNSSKLFYYWQCYMEKPSLNRVLAGAYLWKSGAAGISPYCYQHMPTYPNSPFNDFDEWEPDFHEGGIKRPFKDHMTTYPAKAGVIPTLQWEALRDGITDFKYWFTLHSWIEKGLTSENNDAVQLASTARERSNAILARINLTGITINSETELEPYDTVKPHEYDEFRDQLRSDIEALANLLMS